MRLKKTEFADYIKKFDFRTLFNEMGWNNDKTKHSIVVDNITFTLEAVAERNNFKILVCSPLPNGSIPEYPQRIKIDQKITKFFQEHLLIFVDKKQTEQLWQLVIRQPSKPITVTTTRWYANQKIELLYQRFSNVFFELDEEDYITIIDVKNRLLENFQVNNEKVTKKFYDRFKTEHEKFKSFIKGIKEVADLEWYTSLMLNRLMFIYFIQKKGFLDGDFHYLQKRLEKVQNLKGKDQFHQTFYRYFLLKLFHDGLGKRERNKELEKLIGKIPYLNGGFFEVHEIESRNNNIDIPDEAFERLFHFFDEFEWHLDTRHHATGKEINPDVVGYIFEKYINQKEKGAYYTKEDITEYISKNTIIPFLFDKSGIDENHLVWKLLQDDPDRYIYDAVKQGILSKEIGKDKVEIVSLPPEIEVGINDVYQRTDWNKPASSDYALPTETWREHVARRTRCLDIRNKIKSGTIKTVNDLITLNLDIRQLAQDMIVNTEDPAWLWQFYSALDSVTILDPTCGSGAFLFAAMNILEPLYETCLNRMENMVGLQTEYANVLRKIKAHPNRRYFIYKNIILNNLYGVDIMDEAVEICKLRLFLKLIAEVETVDKIEPLPDIDFNIRSGNTLVGYLSLEQIKATQKNKLMINDDLQKIEQSTNSINDLSQKFRENQTNDKSNFIPLLKQDFRNNLYKLRDQLDHYLANEYKINIEKPKQVSAWQKSHQPFHWIVEFYGILRNGGFDVVIGNPPYVEYYNVKKIYTIKEYETESCGNLYAFVMERACHLIQSKATLGMIVPVSIGSTPRMEPLRNVIQKEHRTIFYSNFADRPSCLFSGVHQILSICLLTGCQKNEALYSSGFKHWNKEERVSLFEKLSYVFSGDCITDNTWGKFENETAINIYQKIRKNKMNLIDYFNTHGKLIAISGGTGGYWLRAFDIAQTSNEYKIKYVKNENLQKCICGLINSSLFYLVWRIFSDCRHLTDSTQKLIYIDFDDTIIQQLKNRSVHHLTLLKKTHELREGKMTYEQYRPSKVKTKLDEIDRVLAQHYGFTEEELDFIINYDIKYRMGGEE
ncbi:MAG: Eco57I restriction-modification methylase domain-containing protein [Planctomycetaceae bacterium]|jgi:tRNA1(Val) A37 N6-methylase TrmN6|nr:Eco57I restriction-modification methylase domain-containing protein [Planctomycetaceae bacterium]